MEGEGGIEKETTGTGLEWVRKKIESGESYADKIISIPSVGLSEGTYVQCTYLCNLFSSLVPTSRQ
jgi:hypothetical protein